MLSVISGSDAVGFKYRSSKSHRRLASQVGPVRAGCHAVHAASFYRRYRTFGRHDKSAPRPKTGLLGIGVAWRDQISAIITGIKDIVRFAPIRSQRADWIFELPRRPRPFANATTGGHYSQRLRQSFQSLFPEPACARNR